MRRCMIKKDIVGLRKEIWRRIEVTHSTQMLENVRKYEHVNGIAKENAPTVSGGKK